VTGVDSTDRNRKRYAGNRSPASKGGILVDVIDFVFDFGATMVAIIAPVALVARWFDRQADAVVRLDGSAAALWPAVREEADPPRWRVELIDRDRSVRRVEPPTNQSLTARRLPPVHAR
jgi:hypothetical protein